MLKIRQTLPRKDYGLPFRIEASTIPEASNLNELYYSGFLSEESKAEFINKDELVITIKFKRSGGQ